MDILTTSTQVDPAVAVFYNKVLLKRALPFLFCLKFAQVRDIPAKRGNIIKFRRYSALPLATTPLTEGITPPGQQLAKTDLTAKIAFYGDFVHLTDVVDLTVEDAVLTETNILQGEQSGQTLEVLMRDILMACASQTNAAGGGNGKTPTEPAVTDVTAVTKALRAGNARYITNVITANDGVGTSPVRAAFWAMTHTDLDDAWEAVAGFKSTVEYPRQDTVLEAEIGAVKNVRLLSSTLWHKDTSTTPDTYKTAVVGKDAYGMTRLSTLTLKNIVKAFGSGGTSDPLDQRATSGWKASWVGRILNDAFMHLLVSSNKAGSG
ncbi:MAG: N4-gp56 family major capsid protein [Candidatus Zixiibacteriota bacterium]|nr:MAG: N4-gp56 family major capsid protein [candidate division Zixibacteria bacterium]